MIVEAAIALSLSSGLDMGTTRIGISKGFKESNPLMGPSFSQQTLYSAAYVTAGTFTSNEVEKHYGRKAGRIVLGIFCAIPISAAIRNGVKIW